MLWLAGNLVKFSGKNRCFCQIDQPVWPIDCSVSANGGISRATTGFAEILMQSLSNEKNLQESDSALMMSFAAGDCEGFELLYRRYSTSIYRFFYFGTHADQSLSAELFYDVWMTVVRGRARYTNDINFTDWLFHSAWARLHDHLRLHSLDREMDSLKPITRSSTVVNMADFIADSKQSDETEEKAEEIIGDVSASKQADDSMQNNLLVEAIRNLSPEQKEVVLLRYCFSMSNQDISEFIDVSKSTVDRIAREASSLLRQNVAESDGQQGGQFNG